MAIADRVYRTCTYIAGDWTGDRDLISKLQQWNENDHLGLNFVDVHELTQSSDKSYPCSIKHSLRQRLNVTKTFVLIVGDNTDRLTKGGCQYCARYVSSWYGDPYCMSGMSIDSRSFIDFECEMALKDYKDGLLKNIVVIYNGKFSPVRDKCPESLRNIGEHIGSIYRSLDGKLHWNYQAIKNAICK